MVWITTPIIDCDNKDLSLEALVKLLIRDSECLPYIDCDNKDEGWQSLVRQLFSILPDGTLALNVCECDGGLG